MPCYINLPLSWAAREPFWLDWLLAQELAPEWGLDHESLALPERIHGEMAGRLRDHGLSCTVHLPFLGLDPAAPDPEQRRKAFTAISQGARLADIYAARLMIGHPGFSKHRDGRGERYADLDEGWLDRSRNFWLDILAASHTPLCLENIYEQSQKVLPAILERMEHSGAGICFDVGHWHAFAGGGRRKDMPDWVEAYAPYIRHLHLHDNHGSVDEHLGIGQGDVDISQLLALMKEYALAPTAALEAHSLEAFTTSGAWFRKHPEEARQVGWADPRTPGLPLPRIFF